AHLGQAVSEEKTLAHRCVTSDEQTMVLSQMNQQLKKVTQERDQLQRRVGELEDELLASKEEIARLKGRAELSDDKLPEAQKRIEELLMKIAVLEYQLKQGD
ncbi:MAG: hypothetical protein AAFR67_02825, partial [Chloroflexota bacterium]